MKILLLTYSLGGTASGIITARVLKGLLENGCEVKVITQNSSSATPNCEIIQLSSLAHSLFIKKIYERILSLFVKDIINSNFLWRIRCYRKAKKIIKEWNPDWIYARSSPFDPCVVGCKLKKKLGIRLLVHFTDPFPAPLSFCPDLKTRREAEKMSKQILRQADILSMGTEESRTYQFKMTTPSKHIMKNSFISPDSCSKTSITYHAPHISNTIHLIFLGIIYGSRNPIPLCKAIEELINEGKNIILHIYSPPTLTFTRPFIRYEGRITNIENALKDANILIDLDGDDTEPVFVSSKLKDYLTVNRPILSITPKNSPSSKILSGLTSAVISENQKQNIKESLIQILSKEDSSYDYSERETLLNRFAYKNITKEIVEKLESFSPQLD